MNSHTVNAVVGSSASDLVRAIADGQIGVVDAVEAHIARIEETRPRLNAVVVTLFDDARRRAAEADRVPHAERGPLHGLPVTVKECFDVAGTPSTFGLTTRASHRAGADAPLVARLRRAGAIVLGKTNVSQLLMYVESDNPLYGRTNSAASPERSAGGSSGGEGAIVAAGGSALGLGTDVGGSIRVPAHANGVHGFKPTPGRLPVGSPVHLVGPAARAAIPDSAGLLARRVADLRLGLAALSDAPAPPAAPSALRIGFYEEDGFVPASPALRRAVREAAEHLAARGWDVKPFAPPDVREGLALFYGLVSADSGAEWRALLDGGAVDPRMQDLLTLTGMPNPLRPVAAALLRLQGQRSLADTLTMAGRATPTRVAELLARQDAYRRRFAAAMDAGGVDVLLCPPCAVPAFRHGATRALGPASVSYTCLYNLLGYPAGVVTTTTVRADEAAGRPPSRDKVLAAARLVDDGSAGLPVGVQVVAPPDGDDRVLAAMAALEEESAGRGAALPR